LKVDALKTRVFRSVGVEIDAVSKELTASNAATLVKQASLVVDTFDNTVSRQMVQDACRAKKLQCLHVGLYQDYGEVVWDDIYRVPNDQGEGDVCDYPLARNIAMLAVIVATEEIMDFCLAKTPRRKSWSITLRDLKIRER
jgi:molybdopterin/thiamine biosynthesis adenylyltransferase